MSQAVAKPVSFDPKLVLPFVSAVRQLFKTMVRVEVTIGKPYVKTMASSIYDVSGIIGFSGEMTGSVAVTFQLDAATKLVESFCGTRLEPNSLDFTDAIGELANMIAGSAKRELDARASITVPTVVVGKGFGFAPVSGIPCLVIPCSTECGDFAVEVAIQKQDK